MNSVLPQRTWAEQTAQAQGLGPRVGSGEVLASVALLFERRSDAPDGRQPRVVKPVQSGAAGADDQVIEDGGDPARDHHWLLR